MYIYIYIYTLCIAIDGCYILINSKVAKSTTFIVNFLYQIDLCPQGCGHGTCIGSDICQCSTGWNGSHCDQGKIGTIISY